MQVLVSSTNDRRRKVQAHPRRLTLGYIYLPCPTTFLEPYRNVPLVIITEMKPPNLYFPCVHQLFGFCDTICKY
ncbi:hypothetical protein P5673_014403 [Acropora cervicornis]|uniref:Uncharacterized protein n=1 Tax=Acropora cervicornis TaxID=6130 RepID=A0AAD9V6B9_ACRCE|nr:hypothetical protein P5673_014403 [Acropora cervicornis]